VYVGGDYRCQADSPNTHIALAFEVPGGWRQEKTAMIVTVLQMLMGGGGSFLLVALGRECILDCISVS